MYHVYLNITGGNVFIIFQRITVIVDIELGTNFRFLTVTCCLYTDNISVLLTVRIR